MVSHQHSWKRFRLPALLRSPIAGLWVSLWLVAASSADSFTVDDFGSLEKIDIHCHIHTDDLDFVAFAKRDRFRFVNMAVHTDDAERMEEKHRTTYLQYRGNPDRAAAVASFPMAGWDEPDWTARTLEYLEDAAAKGAIGIKVWKNIGMEFRDDAGKLVMIDDPQLQPVFRKIEDLNMTLVGHLGEPKNCWLPLEKMTVNNDRSYFKNNPKYHMYLHPEMPSYEQQIDARDRMVARHPRLRFVAAHLASLEWSVEELARFLDRFPNASAGCAARMGQLQYQTQNDRDKVRDFLIRYQDRILYGTDTGVGPGTPANEAYDRIRSKWLRDWRYFNTDENINVPELDQPVPGLALPKEVVRKIYWSNALRMYPSSFGQAR